jgi:hypothetical protein
MSQSLSLICINPSSVLGFLWRQNKYYSDDAFLPLNLDTESLNPTPISRRSLALLLRQTADQLLKVATLAAICNIVSTLSRSSNLYHHTALCS